jgi:hypothetical protein
MQQLNNFKAVGTLPVSQVGSIVAEIEQNSHLWDAYPLRTKLLAQVGGATSQCSDILLSYTSIDNPDILECVDYPAFVELPTVRKFVFWFMYTMQAERLGRVMITKLKPGMKIDPHVDTLAFSQYYDRFHLCLKDNDKTVFRCGDERHRPFMGDMFWFDNTKEHEVFNGGDTERWTLIIDLKKTVVYNKPYQELEFVATPTDGGAVQVRVKDND